MTVSYLGSLTLGECVPMALTANAQLAASINTALPDIEARLAGAISISVQPPPSIPDLIASVNALLASLQTLLAVPLPDVSATLSVIAELQATMAQMQLSRTFSLDFGEALGSPGIFYYLYAGRSGDLGRELGAVLSGGLPAGSPAEIVAGVIMLARDGGAIDALRTVFRT